MANSKRIPVALIGMGRMGQAIASLADSRGCDIVATLDAADTASGITKAQLGGAAVAIEFTEPHSAVANAEACVALSCPVVIGTTGWRSELPRLEAATQRHGGRILWSPNFSYGVQLFLAIAEFVGERMRDTGFDAHLLETHHSAKKDAPSGTAIAIADEVKRGLLQDVPTTSVRVGHVPGTHALIFDAPFEQIRLIHEARDRRVFADGALRAARWLAQHDTPGVYTLRDLLRNDVTELTS